MHPYYTDTGQHPVMAGKDLDDLPVDRDLSDLSDVCRHIHHQPSHKSPTRKLSLSTEITTSGALILKFMCGSQPFSNNWTSAYVARFLIIGPINALSAGTLYAVSTNMIQHLQRILETAVVPRVQASEGCHVDYGTWYVLILRSIQIQQGVYRKRRNIQPVPVYLIDKQPRLVLNNRLHGWPMNRAGLHDVLLEAMSNTRPPRQLSSPQKALSRPAGAFSKPIMNPCFSCL